MTKQQLDVNEIRFTRYLTPCIVICEISLTLTLLETRCSNLAGISLEGKLYQALMPFLRKLTMHYLEPR